MTVTLEFKDFFNTQFGRGSALEGQLSKKDISDNKERIDNLVISFNSDPKLLDEYLQKASATSDTEVLWVLYVVLTGNCGFENIVESNPLRKVLIKYREYLQAIKEYNKPSNK